MDDAERERLAESLDEMADYWGRRLEWDRRNDCKAAACVVRDNHPKEEGDDDHRRE